MNIFTAKSDLDLSINFDNGNAKCLSRNQVISILRRVAKSLRRKQSKNMDGSPFSFFFYIIF
ncbi:hypothetical protein KSP40_PGU008017 [Platanthera guangdongensis]|uniref:Uncharacterized protein n=1 Tax=Platanthera guangdongensis TaxID=2320717 RepID=A0ABR2M944_9ASPA